MEIQFIIQQLQDAYEGDPWFGRCAKALLAEVNEKQAYHQPNKQHSILELVWHMINWREFTISRLHRNGTHTLHYFETNDWRKLDFADTTLWPKGLSRLKETQAELIELLNGSNDDILNERVAERDYNFRKLLHGLIQHDIYHLGQIAYISKLTR